MKHFTHPGRSINRILLSLGVITLLPGVMAAQEEESDNDTAAVFELNPFVVQSDNRGYIETNAVSGTSLNMAVRDLPMSLEVINNKFLTDLQATDLKEGLAYSAGVFTRSYTDNSGANQAGSAERSPSTVGSVNNPFTNTVSIRGFAVPNQQRFGFRIGGVAVGEGFSTVLGGLTDTVNTERLEVVRGPAALLYGVNVLSGVVNVIPKRPLGEFRGNAALSVGSDGFRRGEFDVTGPIIKDRIHYRFMTAQEERDHHTAFRSQEKEYYAGQLEFLFGRKLQILLEAQYGNFRQNGIGPQFFTDSFIGAAPSGNNVNNRDFRTPFYEQIQYGKEDYSYLFERDASDPNDVFYLPKTALYPSREDALPVMGDNYRVTGPDTYFDREEYNLMGLVTLQPLEGLNIELGGYFTHAEEERFTVNPAVFTNKERDLQPTPSDELPFPAFFRTNAARANLWVRQPEVYSILGGYPEGLPLTARSYGLDEAVGFSVTADDIPNLASLELLEDVTTGGLGEVFVVPDTQRRAQVPGTDWNTWNTKFARYYWIKTPTETDSLQLRGRAAYSFESGFPFLGEDSVKHTFIGGYQYTKDELSIVSGNPPPEDVITSGVLEPIPEIVDVSLGRFGEDPYLLRQSVFDMSPIRYNGEPVAIPGALNTSSANMGAPLTLYVNDGIIDDGEINGWNIARSGWRDVTVDQKGYYGIYQAQFLGDKATFYAGIRRDEYQVEEVEQIRALAGVPGITESRNSALTDLYYGMKSYATLPYLIGDASRPYTEDRWISELPDELNREIQREMELLREGIGAQGTYERLFEETQRFTTGSFGLSYRVFDPLSVYVMYSEGVFPNQGQRDGLDRPIPAEQTSSKELGFKFDLLDGRISGTISFYEIERENATWFFNAAPSPRRWVGGALGPSDVPEFQGQDFSSFDARSAISGDGPEAVSAESNWGKPSNPVDYQRYSYGIHKSFFIEAALKHLGYIPEDPLNGAINSSTLAAAGLAFVETTDVGVGGRFENAGLTEGYFWVDVSRDLEAGKHVNADGVDLGLMMQEAFDNALAAKEFDGWSIYWMDSERISPFGAGNNPSNRSGDLVTFSDQTRGLDGQIFFSLTDNYQVIFSFSYQNREIVGNGFNLAPLIDPQTGERIPGTKYDQWVFILGEENFTDPTDPTTFTGGGINGLDLSFVPEYNFSLWNKYEFSEGKLDGVGVALGIRYFGEAPTSIPIGGTDLRENAFPTPPTADRYTIDASLSYSWRMLGLNWRLSLKVNNLLDDTRKENRVTYENPFEPFDPQSRRSVTLLTPRTYRFSLSTRF